MKNLFTILSAFFLVSIIADAQTLKLTHDGKDVASGSTIYFGDYDKDAWEFDGVYEFLPQIFLSCELKTQVSVLVESLDKSTIDFCAFGGCIQTSESNNWAVLKDGTLYAGKPVDLQVHYLGEEGEKEITKSVKVSAWISGKENEKVSFNLVMTNDDELLSVEGIQARNERAVKLIGQDLVYDFATSSARTLSVYGLSGEKVMQENLASAQGRVSLASLSKGLWLYCIEGADGKVSGKVVLKK